jgi:hypothetical protein
VSGYCGFSKSNRAVAAESAGRFPASVVARKLRLPVEFVKSVGTSEWHHTSGWYNCTDYYDLQEVAEYAATEEGKAELEALRQKPAKASKTHHNVRVEWLEWAGTRSHPRAIERKAEGCTVVDDGGAFYKITLPDGRSLKKKKDCNGLYIKF